MKNKKRRKCTEKKDLFKTAKSQEVKSVMDRPHEGETEEDNEGGKKEQSLSHKAWPRKPVEGRLFEKVRAKRICPGGAGGEGMDTQAQVDAFKRICSKMTLRGWSQRS